MVAICVFMVALGSSETIPKVRRKIGLDGAYNETWERYRVLTSMYTIPTMSHQSSVDIQKTSDRRSSQIELRVMGTRSLHRGSTDKVQTSLHANQIELKLVMKTPSSCYSFRAEELIGAQAYWVTWRMSVETSWKWSRVEVSGFEQTSTPYPYAGAQWPSMDHTVVGKENGEKRKALRVRHILLELCNQGQ